MGFDLNVSVPALTVFVQGLLSFFSPCVLPLIPLYIGYLAGGTVSNNEQGEPVYNQKKVMLHTFFFVVGVSFAFFLLGFGMTAIGTFFHRKQTLIARIGGVIIVLFGMYQIGVFGQSAFLSKERKLPFRLEKMTMSPVTALIMGFTFSFAWTPCVGPALASVLLMTASASSQRMGFLLIGLYTLGFVIPFLLVGVFTTKLLSLFKKHRNVVKYSVKIGGILLILMGVLMIAGKMNQVSGFFSKLSADNTAVQEATIEEATAEEATTEGATTEEATTEEATTEEATAEEATAEGATTEEKTPEKETTEESTVEEAEDVDENAENVETSSEQTESESANETEEETTRNTTERKLYPALDFTLTDQYGNSHTLSEYKGKTVFLNFWATWCPPCKAEMPDIQKLYETYPKEGNDAVIFLGIACPDYGQEGSVEEITAFLEENGYTYPVLMDTKWEQFGRYGISSLPTTFMIDRDGNIFGYVTGQLTEDYMIRIIEQTLSGEKN